MRRPDLAIPLLREILPGDKGGLYFSPVMLWIDPAFAPIRDDPRFQALLREYAKSKPAAANVDATDAHG
jgi:hypothetical protein